MEASRRLAARLHTITVLGKHFWTHNFSVSLLLDELGNVPQVTGLIFCKVRLLDGSFTEESPRLEVLHNSVQWGKMFEFECQTAVNSLSGVLDDCMCRLSVRKDTKGGRSYQKVGYVDLNLSEYAGSGYVTRHCLLEGYMNKDNKLDNSLLKVGLHMQLLQGDPCFRVPTQHSLPSGTLSSENVEQPRESTSSHSEPGSSEDILRTMRRQLVMKGGLLLDAMPSQNPEAQERARVVSQLTRVGNTRVDAQDVVEHLCLESLGSVFELPPPIEEAGLALFVGQDGTTTLGVTHIQNR
ncbi:EEIG family member 2-like [Oncorhynchus masou masou]|uniref:EEIG family member 2-like n=1 Tax=Oncorhynchus masou masou TaxID=90313 RepID=UPI0031832D02